MADGQTWFSWLSFPMFTPLSGSVSQDISPRLYRGDPDIEADVIRNVASFGKQLGILSDAVLYLAKQIEPAKDARYLQNITADDVSAADDPLEKLAVLADQIKQIKERHSQDAERDAERALERLRTVNPGALSRLAERLRT